jgi:hypothetical protein
MPRFSCIHRALPPSKPLDGARRCSLGGSASGSPPSGLTAGELALFVSCTVVLPILSSSCCCWRGRPRAGWRSSAIAQLQGFSSCSSAAVSRQWSSTRMTTSFVVERSEPGCGLPLPSASRMFLILAGVERSESQQEANLSYAVLAGCRRR